MSLVGSWTLRHSEIAISGLAANPYVALPLRLPLSLPYDDEQHKYYQMRIYNDEQTSVRLPDSVSCIHRSNIYVSSINQKADAMIG